MSKETNKTPLTKEEKIKEFWRVVKYTLFAISAGVVQIGSFTLFEEVFHWDHWLSYFIALVLSVIWNFTFNRKFTFKSANNIPIAMLKVLAYYVVFTPISVYIEYLLTKIWTFPGSPYVATAINMVINFVTEFLYQRFFVFGKSIDTNDIATKQKQKEENKAPEK